MDGLVFLWAIFNNKTWTKMLFGLGITVLVMSAAVLRQTSCLSPPTYMTILSVLELIAFYTRETRNNNQTKGKRFSYPAAQWATAPQTPWTPDFNSWVKLSFLHPVGKEQPFIDTAWKKDLSEKQMMWSSQSPSLLPQLQGLIVSWALFCKQPSPKKPGSHATRVK